MHKPSVFETNKSFLWILILLGSLFLLHLGSYYRNYQEWISKPFYFTHATVLHSYEKREGKRVYQVLKLRSEEGLTFYTTSYQKHAFAQTRLRIEVFPKATLSFWNYLGGFYVKSRIRTVQKLPKRLKERLSDYVASQHHNASLGSFYRAIFFATPLEHTLREKVALLGISHLVALSGFHLGIIWALVYGSLLLVYRFFQQRYFPYRFALLDVGFMTVVMIGIYVWFVGAPPSLLRSYAMLLIGWAVLLMGMALLSFTFLFTIMALLLALFPTLCVSLGFWLSIAGVFYIFLLLKYTQTYTQRTVSLVVIPLGIFLLMLPVVHGIFGVTSLYQLLSPLLSLLFIPFYPLTILLHLLNVGAWLDPILEWLFALSKEAQNHLLPLWAVGGYGVLSLSAMGNKRAFYLLLTVACLYGLFLFLF